MTGLYISSINFCHEKEIHRQRTASSHADRAKFVSKAVNNVKHITVVWQREEQRLECLHWRHRLSGTGSTLPLHPTRTASHRVDRWTEHVVWDKLTRRRPHTSSQSRRGLHQPRRRHWRRQTRSLCCDQLATSRSEVDQSSKTTPEYQRRDEWRPRWAAWCARDGCGAACRHTTVQQCAHVADRWHQTEALVSADRHLLYWRHCWRPVCDGVQPSPAAYRQYCATYEATRKTHTHSSAKPFWTTNFT